MLIQKLQTLSQLIDAFRSLPNNFIFRGHANAAWPLASSLERTIGVAWSAATAKHFETYSLDRFKAKFLLYDRENIIPDSKLAWLAAMQHYGVPTRLLDFTESPYVALYFALEAYAPSLKADFSVFALDYTAIMEASLKHIRGIDSSFTDTRLTFHPKQDQVFDETVDRFAYDIAWVTEPKRHNQRLDRQGGCFLVSGNRDVRIADALNLTMYDGCKMVKFEIDHSLYQACFALLRQTNVTSKSLYGDLDGLARDIRMQLQVYSAP